MADWFWGATVAVAVGLLGSLVSHFLATKARRKELAESRTQVRREAVYFEAMDYFDRRLKSLQKRTTQPWLPVEEVEGSGVLGRLQIVAGKEVIELTSAYLNEIDLALISLSSEVNSLYLLKVRLDELMESVSRVRDAKDWWSRTAHEFAISGDNRLGKAREETLNAQTSLEKRQEEVRAHFGLYQRTYLSVVEKLHRKAPGLTACQSRLAVAIREELGMPSVLFLIDDAKERAQDFYLVAKSHIDEQRRQLDDLIANGGEGSPSE
ncbi:MAG: hypothetical protein WDA03_12915 [Trueperaceae bacterium]